MKEIIVYSNATLPEEKALCVNGEIVLRGDYYHDHIEDKIEGFTACLDYLDIAYEVTYLGVSPSSPLFTELGFYDGSRETDPIDHVDPIPVRECSDDEFSDEELECIDNICGKNCKFCPYDCSKFCNAHKELTSCMDVVRAWIIQNRGSNEQ